MHSMCVIFDCGPTPADADETTLGKCTHVSGEPVVTLRVRQRARLTLHHSRLGPNDRPCGVWRRPGAQGASAHDSGVPAAMLSPTGTTTPGPCRDGSAIGRSPAPRSTRCWRRTGSKSSGGSECLVVALHRIRLPTFKRWAMRLTSSASRRRRR
jgi:hypothetical protein